MSPSEKAETVPTEPASERPMLLAVFNLLPIPPLDGSKVLRWNVPVYAVTFGVTAVLAAMLLLGVL